MSLYTELVQAGLEVESHRSDLYVRVCKRSQKILAQHPEAIRNMEVFTSEGRLWYSVAFAFDPFWQSACS